MRSNGGENGHGRVRVAIAGLGSRASSPLQGVRSAGIVIGAVRWRELGLDHGLPGSLERPSTHFMKSPARQHTDNDARRLTEEFISRNGRGSAEPSERSAAAAQD